MKKLMLAIVLIALLTGCAPKFEPVGTVLYFESFGEKGRLYIHHADGHEYACVVVAKFAELIKDGFVNTGEQFDCTGLPIFQQDSTVTF